MDAKNSFARKTPFLTAPDGVQYFTGVCPGVTVLTMKSVRLHPSQLEMQNLSGVEFSAPEIDWGELQAPKNSTGVIKISTGGGTQIVYFPLGFGISRVRVTLFSLLSLGCNPMHKEMGNN